MKTAIVIGTRPEIIKMSPLIRALAARGMDFFVLHTGQHYTACLDTIFFEELEVTQPKYNLETGSGRHGETTGRMLAGIENILMEERPELVLVEGDTNSVLAGALAAVKLNIKVGHVEAGLRSGDKTMPEEINRVMVDHISDYLFAPTEKSARLLLHEGIAGNQIFVTGNTIVDAVYQNIEIAGRKSHILTRLGLGEGGYFLVTVHRQENVHSQERLRSILEGLGGVSKKYGMPVIYPIHPGARKSLEESGLAVPAGIELIEPAGYLDFLSLESGAALVLTDSGGVQEETCILQVPCVTLRDNTERPETIEVGGNILAGANPEKILTAAEQMLDIKRNWPNPFGDGKSGERIAEIICGKK